MLTLFLLIPLFWDVFVILNKDLFWFSISSFHYSSIEVFSEVVLYFSSLFIQRMFFKFSAFRCLCFVTLKSMTKFFRYTRWLLALIQSHHFGSQIYFYLKYEVYKRVTKSLYYPGLQLQKFLRISTCSPG